MTKPFVYLASKSPRRQQLLAQLDIEFETFSVEVDETPVEGELPADLVCRLALSKAQASQQALATNKLVLGSDTIVVSPNGEIFGKPTDFADAKRMLNDLSGQTHQVMTAIAIVAGRQHWIENVVTQVTFCDLTESMIADYWATGEPQDKAGSYGIQGLAGRFVTEIKGNYSAVVGLPLYHTAELINQAITEKE